MVRLRFSPLMTAGTVEVRVSLNHQPGMVIEWALEFREMRGLIKHGDRGVCKRSKILVEEDSQQDARHSASPGDGYLVQKLHRYNDNDNDAYARERKTAVGGLR